MEPIITDLRRISKYKVRSHDTSENSHIPLLHSQTKDAPENGPTVVLIGDSMLERMLTTGKGVNFVEPWPSHAMLTDDTLGRVNLGRETKPEVTRLNRVFNAGVGGDKIQNVAYRLAGTPATDGGDGEEQEKLLPGLLPMLAACGTVKLWVVHMGANNLNPKRGLSATDLAALQTLISALGRVNEGKNKVLVTGLTHRKDISRELVVAANVGIETMVKGLDAEIGPARVLFARAPAVDTEKHLDDHVHLNLEGYRLWAEQLVVEVVDSLQVTA
ncbi:SGNH hydrolase-type esterase domain-containing protein [Dichotomopilus funicola]|uniref:SGNH hydrolase-type esterase domain-containing protein n=1 Tax=Dichotomopilus funicola TaxID=1934379 RepID=A0AAN6V1K5_9PEZI|nr:SGNH hydrolase-type esterase domain-containing protein [Dichotomopilus funicola]